MLTVLLQVRPALLNDQSWLRFWVEEHVVLPPGSKLARAKSRRTFSFSKAPASVVSALSSPGAAGMTSGIPPVEGSSSAPVDVTATGQVQAIRCVGWASVQQDMLALCEVPCSSNPQPCHAL